MEEEEEAEERDWEEGGRARWGEGPGLKARGRGGFSVFSRSSRCRPSNRANGWPRRNSVEGNT